MAEVVCDLDGVIYRGDQAIAGAPGALRRLTAAGVTVWYVTNNSTMTPQTVAAKVTSLTGVEVDTSRVMTSSMAAASLLTPDDQPVFVVGESGVSGALAAVGVMVTDDEKEARSVVVGMDRHLTYGQVARAADAVRSGARFVATNTDPTFPIPGGLLPGAGSVVAAIAVAAGSEPEVAGKPHPAMRSLVRQRVGPEAWVIGDRLDTDVALAGAIPGWSSILVLSGVTGVGEAEETEADHVVKDLAAAVDLVLGRDVEA